MDNLWQKTADRIKDRLGQVGYETWIGPLNFVGLNNNTATIQAPNRFFRDWVKDRYIGLLRDSLCAETGQNIDIKLTLGSSEASSNQSPPPSRPVTASPQPARKPAGDRHPHLNPRHTFAEFVVGSANQFAHAAALAVANQPGEKYNPLFIYGGVGLGKTHLVTAIGHHLWATGRSQRILLMPAEVFTNEVVSSIRRDRMGEFKEKFRRVDVLILDDIQFVAGRERTQEVFFHTFNSLQAEGHQVVITSDKIPRDIAGLEERLRNRFESGLIADIAPPDLETRAAIVQKKAEADDLKLPPEVTLYIAQNVASNVREIEGCLTRLAALASINRSVITLDFTRQALRDLVRDQEAKPDIEAIQRTVAEFFHIKLGDLKSKKRTQHVAFCRQVAMYLCRKMTECSFPVIGEHFGRDHSTVIHAFNLIGRRVNSDSAFRFSIEKIERELKVMRNAA